MEYVPFLLICFTFLLPVFLPLIYWYILRKRESKIYGYCIYARRFWAVMMVFMLAVKIFKLIEREGYNFLEANNFLEVLGGVFVQCLMAKLFWKKWQKNIYFAKTEEVINKNN